MNDYATIKGIKAIYRTSQIRHHAHTGIAAILRIESPQKHNQTTPWKLRCSLLFSLLCLQMIQCCAGETSTCIISHLKSVMPRALGKIISISDHVSSTHSHHTKGHCNDTSCCPDALATHAMPSVQRRQNNPWQEIKTTMPAIAEQACPFRRLSNGEWIHESLQFTPIALDFILPEMRAKPNLWLGEGRYLHTLRRLAYRGDPQTVRILSKLQGSDHHKNVELQDLVTSGNATRLAEAIVFCDQLVGEL